MVTEEKKLELLHDHYKDSFTYLRTYIQHRDRLLFFILLVLVIMMFQLAAQSDADQAISQAVAEQFELTTPIDMAFIGSAIWLSLLALVVRYYQRVMLVEKQYRYVHKLEGRLSSHYNDEIFTRESTSYSSSFPTFTKWAWRLYTLVFPVLLLVIASLKIRDELSRPITFAWPLVLNIASFLLLLGFTLLYLYSFHIKNSSLARISIFPGPRNLSRDVPDSQSKTHQSSVKER